MLALWPRQGALRNAMGCLICTTFVHTQLWDGPGETIGGNSRHSWAPKSEFALHLVPTRMEASHKAHRHDALNKVLHWVCVMLLSMQLVNVVAEVDHPTMANRGHMLPKRSPPPSQALPPKPCPLTLFSEALHLESLWRDAEVMLLEFSLEALSGAEPSSAEALPWPYSS